MIYSACPQCKKKVLEDTAGYRCETCNKVYAQCIPTYMLNVKFSDVSGNIFVTIPKDLGDTIMNGQSAEEFKQFREEFGQGGEKTQTEEMNDFYYET